MKKLLAVLALGLVLLLASCGGAADRDTSGESGDEQTLMTVCGDGVEGTFEFSLNELKALDDRTLTYSTVNNYPSSKYAKAQGCSLRAALNRCGLSEAATLITVAADDGFSKTFTVEQLLGGAYFYAPNGDPTAVEPILAWAFSDSTGAVPGQAEPLDGLRLVLGQQGPHDANAASSVQNVSRVEVSCQPVSQLAPCGFAMTEQGLVELIYENMDQVKIYYTLDGSDPDPLTSPVYNPSTSNFQPELIAPLAVASGTLVRARVVGLGYLDSEISEYVAE